MRKNTKGVLEAHSEAKVKMIMKYLEKYISIMNRSKFQNIYILDLFSGEGIYEESKKRY